MPPPPHLLLPPPSLVRKNVAILFVTLSRRCFPASPSSGLCTTLPVLCLALGPNPASLLSHPKPFTPQLQRPAAVVSVCVRHPHSYVGILMPNVMVLGGDKVHKHQRDSGSWAQRIKEPHRAPQPLLPCEDTVRSLPPGREFSPKRDRAGTLLSDF